MKGKMSKSPLLAEGKPQHAKPPVVKPPRQPLIADAKGNGRKTTFTAPRKGDDYNPSCCGYTKVK